MYDLGFKEGKASILQYFIFLALKPLPIIKVFVTKDQLAFR